MAYDQRLIVFSHGEFLPGVSAELTRWSTGNVDINSTSGHLLWTGCGSHQSAMAVYGLRDAPRMNASLKLVSWRVGVGSFIMPCVFRMQDVCDAIHKGLDSKLESGTEAPTSKSLHEPMYL